MAPLSGLQRCSAQRHYNGIGECNGEGKAITAATDVIQSVFSEIDLKDSALMMLLWGWGHPATSTRSLQSLQLGVHMKRYLALVIFPFALAAQAQPGGDASSTRSEIFDSKPQQRAEQRKDARPAGKVKPTGGDELKTPEDGSFGNDKSGAAAERRVEAREARYPNRRPAQQGGTPDLPGAK